MADQQPLNATFFAFRKREKGGVLLGATLAYAVLALAAIALFAWFNWRGFVDYLNWAASMSQSAERADDPSAVFAGLMPPASVMNIFVSLFLFQLLYYLLLASFEAACLKWMIRGETGGLFGLALDADMLRVYLTYWLWYFLFLAIYFVFVLIGVGVMVGVAFSAHGNTDAMGPAAVIIPLVFVFAALFALVYLGVRFAPAAATSIARRRFAFFDAWTVTKGRFWALLGSFALLFLMYFIGVIVLSAAASMAIGAGVAGQVAAAPEPQSIEEAFALFASPTVWAPLAVCYGLMIVGSFVFYVALYGVNARAAQAALEEGKIEAAA